MTTASSYGKSISLSLSSCGNPTPASLYLDNNVDIDYTNGKYFLVGGDSGDNNDWVSGKISSIKILKEAIPDDKVVDTTINNVSNTATNVLNFQEGYIEVPSNSFTDFSNSDDFTLEARIKIDQFPESGSSAGNSSSPNRNYIISKKNVLGLYLINLNGETHIEGRFRKDHYGDWPNIISTEALVLDRWYHVAFVTNISGSSGVQKLYIDGTLVNSTSFSVGGSSSGITQSNNRIGIGANLWSETPSQYFKGSISEVRMWDIERSDSEIDANKNTQVSVNSNLKLYYQINEGSENTVTDISGNNLNGTINGTYTWVDTTPENNIFSYDFSNTNSYSGSGNTVNDLSSGGNNGVVLGDSSQIYFDSNENAFFFDESNSEHGIAIQNHNYVSGASDQIENLTLSAKIKLPNSTSNRQRIILSYDRSTVFRFTIGSDASNTNLAAGKLAFMFTNSSGSIDKYDAGYSGDLRDNQWHDVMVKFEANKSGGLKYYVDGVLTYTDPDTYAPISNQDTNETPRFGVIGNGSEMTSVNGSRGPTDPFSGWIKSIKFSENKVIIPQDTLPPTVMLTKNRDDFSFKHTDVITITAQFSEAMTPTPTLNISGVASNVLMDATSSTSVWTYNWVIPNIQDTIVSVNVSGTDLAGNPYNENEELVLLIDNTPPISVLSVNIDDTENNQIGITDPVKLEVTFSEPISTYPNAPKLLINGTAYDLSHESILSNGASSSTIDYFTQLISSTLSLDTSNTISYDVSSTLEEANIRYDYFTNAISSTFSYLWDPSTATSSIVVLGISASDLAGNSYQISNAMNLFVDNEAPTVSLSHTDDDAILSNQELVTITATFSEEIQSSPSVQLSGLGVTANMSPTLTEDIWIYSWNVSYTGDTMVSLTVSATDKFGNSYSGSDTLSFQIDNTPPTVILTDTDSDNLISSSDVVTLTATFSEAMASSPTLYFSDNQNKIVMTQTTTDSIVWIYRWEGISSSVSSVSVTVSGTDVAGNPYLGNASLTFVLDNTPPTVMLSHSNTNNTIGPSQSVTITAEFSEPMSAPPSINITGIDRIEPMLASGIENIWLYSLQISSATVTQVKVNVIGEDLVGNPYTGNEEIIFSFDHQPPTITITDNDDGDGVLLKGQSLDIYLNSDEELIEKPIFYEKSIRNYNADGNEFSNDTDEALFIADMGNNEYYRAYSVVSIESLVSGTVTFTITATDKQGNTATTTEVYSIHGKDISADLSHSATSNFVKPNEAISISANFNQAIALATINVKKDGVALLENESMTVSPSSEESLWTYDLNLNQTDGNISITVSAVGVYGNLYSGTDSLTFSLDGSPPSVKLSHNLDPSKNNVMGVNSPFKVFALFSEPMENAPVMHMEYTAEGQTNSLLSDQTMQSENSSNTFWSYQFNPESQNQLNPFSPLPHQSIITATVSGSDLTGNSYSGKDELMLTLDKAGPKILKMEMDTENSFTVTFDEPPFKQGITPGELIPLTANDFNISLVVASKENVATGDVSNTQNTLNALPENPTSLSVQNEKLVFSYDALLDMSSGVITLDKVANNIVDQNLNLSLDFENNELSITGDADNDGVADFVDACPGTPIGEAVDEKGCSKIQIDQDGDGIPNDKDLCPNTPKDEEVNAEGCGPSQVDTDKDGIPDVKDNCPEIKNVMQKDKDKDGYGDLCDPDPIVNLITFDVKEDIEIGTVVGAFDAIDPMGNGITSVSIESDGFFKLVGDKEIVLIRELDYELFKEQLFTITAKTELGETSIAGKILVEDVPNAKYVAPFFISVFGVDSNSDPSGRGHERYFNPFNRGVGKWKIRKNISGGADAHLFAIKSAPSGTRKNEEESEGYLGFINPPDFDNPQDHNQDNIYEVEITYVNTEDGAIEVPVPVTQFQLQVPEGAPTSIELQSRPALPTDDTDNDGVPDIEDNSPVVYNPNQADRDGDGVGDVSDDADHDGIWDPQDECPDTPLGTKVNFFGCEIYYLSSENFNVYKTERCEGSHSISINFINRSPNYIIEVTGAINSRENFSGRKWNISSLKAGDYSVCITVEGVNPGEFERCFQLELEDPPKLSVDSRNESFSLSNDTNVETILYDLDGGDVYNITHNGITSQTARSSHQVTLKTGLNTVKISTGNECQGVFEQQYFLSEEVTYTPNPFQEEFVVYVGGSDRHVQVDVFSAEGRLISSRNHILSPSKRDITVDASEFKLGSYLIKVNADHVRHSFIAIKK